MDKPKTLSFKAILVCAVAGVLVVASLITRSDTGGARAVPLILAAAAACAIVGGMRLTKAAWDQRR